MKGVVKGSAMDGVKSATAADALAEDVLAVKGTALRAKAGPKGSGSVFCRVGAAVDRNGEGASNGEGVCRLSRSEGSLMLDFEGFLVIIDFTVGGFRALTCALGVTLGAGSVWDRESRSDRFSRTRKSRSTFGLLTADTVDLDGSKNDDGRVAAKAWDGDGNGDVDAVKGTNGLSDWLDDDLWRMEGSMCASVSAAMARS